MWHVQELNWCSRICVQCAKKHALTGSDGPEIAFWEHGCKYGNQKVFFDKEVKPRSQTKKSVQNQKVGPKPRSRPKTKKYFFVLGPTSWFRTSLYPADFFVSGKVAGCRMTKKYFFRQKVLLCHPASGDFAGYKEVCRIQRSPKPRSRPQNKEVLLGFCDFLV